MSKGKKIVDTLIIFTILFISLPLSALGLWFTDNRVILPGDTTGVSEVIEIEGASKSAGSFSTIYVTVFEHSTKLQNLIIEGLKYGEVEEISSRFSHISNSEFSKIGKIQYESSQSLSIIVGYLNAKYENEAVLLDYSLDSLAITYYLEDGPFKTDDRIIGINDTSINDPNFKNKFNNRKPKDILKVRRNDSLMEIILDDNNFRRIYFEPIYKIDYEKMLPKLKIFNTNLGGPSGGFMRALAIYDALTEYDYSKGLAITGTGTISINGMVGPIGGIKEKIITAFKDNKDIFFCPIDNYNEALESYNRINGKERMKLYPISEFKEALEVLRNV